MTLLGGDLTTPARVATWLPNPPTLPSAILSQLIGSMTALIYAKLNRSRTYSQPFTRVFDGVGNMQLVLPDYPVTSVSLVQARSYVIPPAVIPLNGAAQPVNTNPNYGYKFIPWLGNLPGENAVLEFACGYFPLGAQNIIVQYTAGYLTQNEPWVVPATGPFTITTLQQQGIWCRDNGVVYASTGVALTPVASAPAIGQYVAPPDVTPGLYTFSAADASASLLVSYSFIPAALEEATIQMVAERYAYRTRVGEISKSLGGQETVRFMRGSAGAPYARMNDLPPEVMDLIYDYISVLPPLIGAPV